MFAIFIGKSSKTFRGHLEALIEAEGWYLEKNKSIMFIIR